MLLFEEEESKTVALIETAIDHDRSSMARQYIEDFSLSLDGRA